MRFFVDYISTWILGITRQKELLSAPTQEQDYDPLLNSLSLRSEKVPAVVILVVHPLPDRGHGSPVLQIAAHMVHRTSFALPFV